MEKTFISICIPSYKRTDYLQRLLHSISLQSYTNYEIIISDDSPDDTVHQMCSQFSTLPIFYYKNELAPGSPGNWNNAIQLAQGKWIKLMHDDDWFATSDALQQFADSAEKNKYDFIFSAFDNIYSSGKTVKEFLTPWRKEMLDDNPLNLFFLNVIGHPSTVMHKKDSDLLYDLTYKWVVDIDFYIRYLLAHPGYVYIPSVLVNIGTDQTQLSASFYKNREIEIPEYFSLLAKYPSDTHLKNQYVFYLVWNMLKRYKIKSINGIRESGYHGPLCEKTEDVISYQNKIPDIILKQRPWSKKLMSHCFKKITQGLYK